MFVKDIIKLACDFIGQQSLKSAIESGTLTEDEQLIFDSLLNCFNLVYDEVACEYFPICKYETVKCEDFKVNFSSLSYKPLQIISVKDGSGRAIKFKVFEDYFIAIANTVTVLYSIKPSKLDADEEFESILPQRVYAYAIAREYFFLQALFDDADIWETRFKNSLQIFHNKKKEIRIPRRRWL